MRNLAITFTSLQAVSRLKWECEEFRNNVYKFTAVSTLKWEFSNNVCKFTAVSRLQWECEEFSNNVYKFTGGVQVKVGM